MKTTTRVFVSIVVVCLLGLGVLWLDVHRQQPKEQTIAGIVDYSFTNATSNITSAGTSTLANITTWTALPIVTNAADGYVAICDNADNGINTSNPVYVGFGSTSTKPYGYRLGSGACHTMTLSSNNM